MIKKVVDKPDKRVKEMTPEFDSEKIYILETSTDKSLYKLQLDNRFTWAPLHYTGHCGGRFLSFKGACMLAVGTVYILDNQEQLARFILGCREFPIVQEIVVEEALAEDEVSIEDVSSSKLYAYYSENAKTVMKLQYGGNFWAFCNLKSIYAEIDGNYSTRFSSVKAAIRYVMDAHKASVYQFDTLEEFLKWAYERVTGTECKGLHISPLIQRALDGEEVFIKISDKSPDYTWGKLTEIYEDEDGDLILPTLGDTLNG